jgi:hypothetical protein
MCRFKQKLKKSQNKIPGNKILEKKKPKMAKSSMSVREERQSQQNGVREIERHRQRPSVIA